MIEYLLVAVLALVVGALVGWLAGRRDAAGIAATSDEQAAQFKRAITDLAAAEERARAGEALRSELAQARDEREAARLDVSRLEAEGRAAEQRIADLRTAADEMSLRSARWRRTLWATRRSRSSNVPRRAFVRPRSNRAGASRLAATGERPPATL